jgi:hypothetical protein
MRRPNYPVRNQDFLYEFTVKYTSKSCHLKMAALKHKRVQINVELQLLGNTHGKL